MCVCFAWLFDADGDLALIDPRKPILEWEKKKKQEGILLKHIKDRSDFSIIKNYFFIIVKQIWSFIKKKKKNHFLSS